MRNPYEVLERETFKLVKQNGTVVEGLKCAGVKEDGKVTFYREDVNFEEGDTLERPLPNGRMEYYIIDDIYYRAEIAGAIPGNYVLRVRNVNKPKQQDKPQVVTYNLNGPNTRVNVHSDDHSHNIINIDANEVFAKTIEILSQNVKNKAELEKLKSMVEDMRASQGKSTFLSKYAEFMSISADHMTVLAPVLPALAQIVAYIHMTPKG